MKYPFRLKQFFWLLPFVSFWLGYLVFNKLVVSSYVDAPDVVGKSIHDVVAILSPHQLNARIITQKEDPDIAEGVVLSQQPKPGKRMRPHASLFLITSKKPPLTVAPQCIGSSEKEYMPLISKLGVRHRLYHLASKLPKGTCIGQFPASGKPLTDNSLILYVSIGSEEPLLFPDLCGLSVSHVRDFMREQELGNPRIIHMSAVRNDHVCNDCIVVEQKPIAGSFINIDKSPAIYVRVR